MENESSSLLVSNLNKLLCQYSSTSIASKTTDLGSFVKVLFTDVYSMLSCPGKLCCTRVGSFERPVLLSTGIFYA